MRIKSEMNLDSLAGRNTNWCSVLESNFKEFYKSEGGLSTSSVILLLSIDLHKAIKVIHTHTHTKKPYMWMVTMLFWITVIE